MTLPFPNKDDNKRKYCCFCCGVQFTEITEFRTHILEKHDEGRDYVLCPCQWCKIPVRDLKSHWVVFHPSQPLPKNRQMKAIIWRDFSPKGKAKTRKKFKDGWYESTKMNKRFYFRSGWEETVYECLDQMNEVTAYEAEPFKIPYIWNGSQHEYSPDILVVFADGHREVWEIKPADQTALEQNQCKWRAAVEVCKPRGWEFVVQTEKGINLLKKKVRRK
jgi:hypothetical protein